MLLLNRGESFDANFYYHSGVDIDHAFFLANGAKRALFVPKMNQALARESFRGRVVGCSEVLAELKKNLRGKVLCDASSLSAGWANRLQRFCKLKDYSNELLLMRLRKKKGEVAKISRAARHTKEIINSLDFKKAKTELGLKKQLLVATAELGLEPAFEPIVASGRTTAFPHYRAGNRKLGSVVLVDYGVTYEYYRADISRCFILDGDRKKKEEYEKLKDVCHSIIDSLPELRTGKDVAKLSARLMKKAGFPEMIHSIGHGVGLDIHELPHLNFKSKDKIAGAVMAIEPAFYLKKYGMRYEETVYFDGKKSRIF